MTPKMDALSTDDKRIAEFVSLAFFPPNIQGAIDTHDNEDEEEGKILAILDAALEVYTEKDAELAKEYPGSGV